MACRDQKTTINGKGLATYFMIYIYDKDVHIHAILVPEHMGWC